MEETPARLKLLLDIDETLVHTVDERGMRYEDPEGIFVHTPLEVERASWMNRMIERPGLRVFLKMVGRECDVYLYTSGCEEYAQAVKKALDPSGELIRGAFGRPQCGTIYFRISSVGCTLISCKNFRWIFGENCDPRRVVLVDDLAVNHRLNPDNGIYIPGFFASLSDEMVGDRPGDSPLRLEQLGERILRDLVPAKDVRDVLGPTEGVLIREKLQQIVGDKWRIDPPLGTPPLECV